MDVIRGRGCWSWGVVGFVSESIERKSAGWSSEPRSIDTYLDYLPVEETDGGSQVLMM